MKSGRSSLNPYAKEYIPVSRMAPEQNKGNKTTDFKAENQRGNETADFKAENQGFWMGSDQFYEDPKLKGRNFASSFGSSSQNAYEATGKQAAAADEDYDMDLAYLQMTFPGVSEESLFDIYIANKGDLELTVDMLNHLEQYSSDSLENLPDSLDIGDESEAGTSSEAAALKLKNVAGEAGGSSSGQPLRSPQWSCQH